MENNARCPVCNGEFFTGENDIIACPHCGARTEGIRARKYFIAFHGETAKKDLHGKEYFNYESLLAIGADHLALAEYDKAEEAYDKAISVNPGDYRGFMGLVAVKTKNYTDLGDESHKQFLKRALAVSDEAGKKRIAEIYRAYGIKASMTEEELAHYNSEKQKDFKARIKKAILGFSKVNEAGKKKAKNAIWIMASMIAVGVITCVLGLVFNQLVVTALGVGLAFGAYGVSIIITKQRFYERLYELLAALFNGLVGFGITFGETEELLQMMSKLLVAAKDGAPTSNIDKLLEELCSFAQAIDNKQLIGLLKGYKLTAKYWK